MLHQDIKSPDLLRPKNQVKLHLCWKQSIKKVAFSNMPKYFNVIMVQSLKIKCQSCLKNTMFIFEEQQQNTSILIWSLWKPLTKIWKNCCELQKPKKAGPLDKKYPEEAVLLEDGLYRYLYQPGEQHGEQKR